MTGGERVLKADRPGPQRTGRSGFPLQRYGTVNETGLVRASNGPAAKLRTAE